MSNTRDPWEEVLDDLEGRLSLEGANEPDWFPPSNLGPLPAALLGRARQLALAQEDLVAALDSSLDAAAEELTALKPGRRDASPIYLDVMG
ncbi:hypothetical protein AAGW05_04990 [Arthrobacter sp. LAPM80]|uniref:hypothetical protein n=1 Tax=Arthrobacter sp. LAPM80 TaxID=3141788 RepID=UPI00398B8D36